MRNLSLIGIALMLASSPAHAGGVSLSSAVMREVAVQENGQIVAKLVPATKVVPGDVVTYVLSYANAGAKRADDLVVGNAVPANLEFVGAEGALLSVDGGKRFGALADLRVVGDDGTTRFALPRDVTHVRWTIATLAPGAAGQVAYRARLK